MAVSVDTDLVVSVESFGAASFTDWRHTGHVPCCTHTHAELLPLKHMQNKINTAIKCFLQLFYFIAAFNYGRPM